MTNHPQIPPIESANQPLEGEVVSSSVSLAETIVKPLAQPLEARGASDESGAVNRRPQRYLPPGDRPRRLAGCNFRAVIPPAPEREARFESTERPHAKAQRKKGGIENARLRRR
jgi:hypothetical protein